MEPVSRDDLTLGSNAVLIATVVDECESGTTFSRETKCPSAWSHSAAGGDR